VRDIGDLIDDREHMRRALVQRAYLRAQELVAQLFAAVQPHLHEFDAPFNRRERRAQVMRGRGEEVVAHAQRVLDFFVQARVVDRQGGAARQLLGQRQVRGAVAPRRTRRHKRQHTQRASARHERHAHVRHTSHLPQQTPMLSVVRDVFQKMSLDGGDHMWPAAAQRFNVGVGASWVRRIEARQLAQRIVFAGVGVCGGETMQRAVFREEVDDTPVGEFRRRQAGYGGERRRVIER